MSKINVGDYVYVTHHHKNGTVISCRGGYVGRWYIELDDGTRVYASSRDCVVLESKFPPRPTNNRITLSEKVDLLMDYLGVRVEDEPKIVKVDEVSSSEK